MLLLTIASAAELLVLATLVGQLHLRQLVGWRSGEAAHLGVVLPPQLLLPPLPLLLLLPPPLLLLLLMLLLPPLLLLPLLLLPCADI